MSDIGVITSNKTLIKGDTDIKGDSKIKETRIKAEKVKKAVIDFEALFINHMLKTMRSTIVKSDLLGSGMGEDVYTSLFDWEISKVMAAGTGLGLGKMLLQGFKPNDGTAEKKAMPGVGEALNLQFFEYQRQLNINSK